MLKGYSLATNYSTYIAKFANTQITNVESSTGDYYLIGYVGGTTPASRDRGNNSSQPNKRKFPNQTGDSRTYKMYVNAPKDGDYYLKGIYNTGESRDLKITVANGTATNENVMTITNLLSNGSWDTSLREFDSSASSTTNQTADSRGVTFSVKTLKLKKGLNKVIITGGTQNRGDAPNFGNFVFTLKAPEAQASDPAAQS